MDEHAGERMFLPERPCDTLLNLPAGLFSCSGVLREVTGANGAVTPAVLGGVETAVGRGDERL